MNEQHYKTGVFIVLMFICLESYKIGQDIALSRKIAEYEEHVRTANMWTILTRGGDYSSKHPDEWSTINILLNIKNCELRKQ